MRSGAMATPVPSANSPPPRPSTRTTTTAARSGERTAAGCHVRGYSAGGRCTPSPGAAASATTTASAAKTLTPTILDGDGAVFVPLSVENAGCGGFGLHERAGGRRDGRRQRSRAFEPLVDGSRRRAAFGDGPHDQALAPAHVAAHEDAVARRRERGVAADIAPLVELDAELLEQTAPVGTDEAHGQQHEITVEVEVGAFDLHEAPVDHLDLVGPQGPQVAVKIADEALGVHREHPLAALLVRGRHAEDERPCRPWVGVGTLVRRARQDLELVDRLGALPPRGAEAVGAGVATAD